MLHQTPDLNYFLLPLSWRSLLEGADGWAEDEKEEKEEDKKWVSNFWRAFDSLSLRQDDAYDLLQQRGISLSITAPNKGSQRAQSPALVPLTRSSAMQVSSWQSTFKGRL